jgi:hypothetical protein
MLLIININKPTYLIPRHVIDKKSMQKIKIFNVKWTLKNKNLRQSHHLKLLKINKHIY